MFGGVSDFSCKYTHGTSTVGGGGKATVRTTVRTDLILKIIPFSKEKNAALRLRDDGHKMVALARDDIFMGSETLKEFSDEDL